MALRFKEALVLFACIIGGFATFEIHGRNKIEGVCTFRGITIEAGNTHYFQGKCEAFVCNESNFRVYGCEDVSVPGSCEVVEDLSKNYPDCCAKVIC
uniref:PXCC family protein n=1 Tax=Scytodes thoracica TaxID=1112478 RepID=A0A0A0V5L2_SCYTH|nr:PXCC family protein [Scytodes thoracica]